MPEVFRWAEKVAVAKINVKTTKIAFTQGYGYFSSRSKKCYGYKTRLRIKLWRELSVA